jgi:UTP--glucose-1-phosphate uridylyltransferase
VKGVLLCAGYGSRFLPVTRVVPKELLPIGTRPALDFVVEELARAGVDELLVITTRRKRPIEDWFDRDPELDAVFDAERLGYPAMRTTFVRQETMTGTGHALRLARTFAGGDPVIVAYPDDLFDGDCARLLVDTWRTTGCSVLACGDLTGQDVSRYGVVDVGNDAEGDAEGLLRVRDIVEKPAPGTEPSHLVSWGRYLFTPELFPALDDGWRRHGDGEFYATEAIRDLARKGRVVARVIPHRRWDTGEPLGYTQTIIDRALEDPKLGPPLRAWLSDRLKI